MARGVDALDVARAEAGTAGAETVSGTGPSPGPMANLYDQLVALGRRPTVEEWSDAVAVALASGDLSGLAAEQRVARLAARLRPVLVKSSEPLVIADVDRAVRAAFAPPPRPSPGSGARFADGAGETARRSRLESLRLSLGASVRGGLAALGAAVRRLTRHPKAPALLAVALAAGIAGLAALTGPEPDGPAPADRPIVEPPRLEPDPDVSPDRAGPPSAPDQDEAALAEIGFRIALSSDDEGRTNLRAIARALGPMLPPATSEAAFLSRLVTATGIAPSTVFALDPAAFERVLLESFTLTQYGADPDPDTLAAMVGAVLIANDRPPDPVAPFDLIRSFTVPLPEIRASIRQSLAEGTQDRFSVVLYSILPTSLAGEPTTDFQVWLPVPERRAFTITVELAPAESAASLTASGLPVFGPVAMPLEGAVVGWWPLALAAGLPALVLVWRAATYRRRLRAWFQKRAPDEAIEPHYTGGVHEALDRAMGSDARLRAARDLARPLMVETQRLDPDRTALASAAAGGRIAPVMRRARRTPRYVALVISEGPDDLQATRYRELAKSLKRLRTTIDLWFIEHDANAVWSDRDPRRRALDELAARLPDRRLLVFGPGDVFLDRATGQPRPWAAALSRWPAAALLTPVPQTAWGAREATLSRLFGQQIAEATAEGLATIARSLAEDTLPEIRPGEQRRDRIWERDPGALTRRQAPDAQGLAALGRDLAEEFDAGGLLWLRATAVYPALRWDLTLYLGDALREGADGPKLITPTRFARLAALPWMREGMMPLWARRWLVEGLSKTERAEVVSRLCGRLGEARARPAGADEPAFVTAVSGAPGPISHRRDPVFLELLARHPPTGDVAMETTRKLADRFDAARRRFLWREGAVVGALAAYGGAALWLAPAPGALMVAGDHLALLALATGLALLPLAHRLLRAGTGGLADRAAP